MPSPASRPALDVPPQVLRAALSGWKDTGRLPWLPVTGTSMLPLLRPGDEVLLAPDAFLSAAGGIAAFRRRGVTYIHRLLDDAWLDHPGLLLFQGDNNPHPDAPVDLGDVLGTVLARRRQGRAYDLQRGSARWVGKWVGILLVIAHWAAPAGAQVGFLRRALRKLARGLCGVLRWVAWGR